MPQPPPRSADACSHAWSCPVIMKTVPDCVAWTCARCGAIATTPIGLAPAQGEPDLRPRFAA